MYTVGSARLIEYYPKKECHEGEYSLEREFSHLNSSDDQDSQSEEFGFQIMKPTFNEIDEVLATDFKKLSKTEQERILSEIALSTFSELKKFMINFHLNEKSHVSKINCFTTGASIVTFFYAGPLSAIFTMATLEIIKWGALTKKMNVALQYFPKEEIMKKTLYTGMTNFAKEIFYKYQSSKPKNFEEAKTLYRKLVLKYHPDHNSQKNASEIFQDIHFAYTLFEKYSPRDQS